MLQEASVSAALARNQRLELEFKKKGFPSGETFLFEFKILEFNLTQQREPIACKISLETQWAIKLDCGRLGQ